VSLRSIAGYEGGSEVRPNTARKLADALGVEVGDLLSEAAAPKAQRPLPFDEPERARIDFVAYAASIDGFSRYWDRAIRVEGRRLDRRELHDFLAAVQVIVLSLREVMRAADAQDRRLMKPSLQRFVIVADAVGQLAEDKDEAAVAVAEAVAELREAA
jgi:hypothetical protein